MDLGLGFDQAAIGMALVGRDGRFQRVNRALCELLGRSEDELLALTIDDLADPGEVLVSHTVRDLVFGSAITFRGPSSYTLRGVPGDWRVYTVGRT